MRRSTRRGLLPGMLAAAITLAAPGAQAVLPLVAGLGRQILQNMIFGQVKAQLIGTLTQSGCKGARLAGMIAQAGHAPALPGLGGGALPTGLPGLGNLAGVAGVAGGAGAAMQAGGPSGAGMAAPSPEQLAAMMAGTRGMGPAGMPTASPEALERSSAMLGQMQAAMAQPLSRAETLEVFGELRSLGLLDDAMLAETRDCVLLAPESASAGIGGTGALFKTMLLPRLVETRARLAALPPEQQQQLAEQIAEALREASPADRRAFRDGFGAGFIPPAVVQQLRERGALD